MMVKSTRGMVGSEDAIVPRIDCKQTVQRLKQEGNCDTPKVREVWM